MFNCRVCSSFPFDTIFGNREEVSSSSQSTTAATSSGPKPNKPSVESNIPNKLYDEQLLASNVNVRSPEEIATVCEAWENYVHPRAKEFWHTSENVQQVLSTIARSIDRGSDPVLGDEDSCVIWRGKTSAEDNYPIFPFLKPGESEPSYTYVNRALALIYADEESFVELQQKSQSSLEMACGNKLCVQLTHISLD
ncbi:hypothetical protein IE077_001214 [Cardiosporidium cionae]|uniref:Uncharacterized protein n=1 Tax=Cardiosporidium cionae TaxID=476202 RepID=A0ABQ7JDJ9_9APIC|nr:hypothetical protein IE077_001214 [Cardiosporidium cionae]|eukprot:KAF8822018.1 hypothetical protein IE077_001214 [Cardiosporidium cionae]